MTDAQTLPAACCLRCRRPRAFVTLDWPAGAGRRTLPTACACEGAAREAAAQAARLHAHVARVRRSLAQAGIAPRHATATFETFQATLETAPAVQACRTFVATFPAAGRGLTLCGPPGAGKTHLAVGLTRTLAERGVAAVLVNVPRLFWLFRTSVGAGDPRGFDDRLELVIQCDHLVLDDLGRERATDWTRETLYLVLDARYEACRPTTLTTNLSPAQLRRHVGEALADRLAETNETVWCPGPSQRRARPPGEVR